MIEPVKSHKSSTDQFMAQETEAVARAKIQTAQDIQMRPNAAWSNAANASTNGVTATSAPGVVEAKNATPQTASTASNASTSVMTESVARKEIPENLRDYPQHIQAYLLLQPNRTPSVTLASNSGMEQAPQGVTATENPPKSATPQSKTPSVDETKSSQVDPQSARGRKPEQTQLVAPTQQSPAQPAAFDPNARADQLVAGATTQDGINGAEIGKEIASMAKVDQANAAASFDKAMDKLPEAVNRREAARGLTGGLNHDELRAIAGNREGRTMLGRAAQELNSDNSTAEEKEALSRIQTATTAADLQSIWTPKPEVMQSPDVSCGCSLRRKNSEITKLDPAVKQQALDIIKAHEKEPEAAKNVEALVNSPGFQEAKPVTQIAALTALDRHNKDSSFTKALTGFMSSSGFKSLSPEQQADTIQRIGFFSTPDKAPGRVLVSKEVREAGFTSRHPIAATEIGQPTPGEKNTNISTNAVRFSTNNLGLTDNAAHEGSQVNAFRHVLWQAKITREFGKGIATEIGNAHEDDPYAVRGFQDYQNKQFKTLSEADQTVDLLNNMIGREIGRQNFNANMKVLAQKTLEYHKDHGLWIVEKRNDGTYKIVQEKLSSQQYQKAAARLAQLDENGFAPGQK